jgi:four helix bundle protein
VGLQKSDDEKPRDLRVRTREFALRIIRLYSSLPKSVEIQVIGKQLLRSGTSVGAHYREAYRARSTAEFISKIGGALMELEETAYWVELLEHGSFVKPVLLRPLQQEINELTAILVSSSKTAKDGRKGQSPRRN